MEKRKDIDSINYNYDLISAIWILSCKDENPIMTYQGIIHRLSIDNKTNIKSLIKSRGELFRQGIPEDRLNEWKAILKLGKKLPSWLKDKSESDRVRRIEKINVADIFRNQFRTKENAPETSIDIINWGLEHIERLRNAAIKNRSEHYKKITNILIPLISMSVALLTVLSGAVLQYQNNYLKKYETTIKPKQEAYTLFMSSVIESYDNTLIRDYKKLEYSLKKIEMAFYQFEPFLTREKRDTIWQRNQNFKKNCLDFKMLPAKNKDLIFLKQFEDYKNIIHQELYESLFITSHGILDL